MRTGLSVHMNLDRGESGQKPGSLCKRDALTTAPSAQHAYLYRYSSSGTYYAVFRANSKLIWKSLKTADRELAKRKLKEEPVPGIE